MQNDGNSRYLFAYTRLEKQEQENGAGSRRRDRTFEPFTRAVAAACAFLRDAGRTALRAAGAAVFSTRPILSTVEASTENVQRDSS